MAIFHQHAFDFAMNPPPPQGTELAVHFSPIPLQEFGLNLPVEISTATVFRNPPLSAPLFSIAVTAHFDTGASSTAIDIDLAKHLNLHATGQSEIFTAAGKQTMPNFAIDIGFLNTKLSPFYNLRVSSCKLGFTLEDNVNLPRPQNMGILIGRDIMSKWNIIWNGTTSTVFISD